MLFRQPLIYMPKKKKIVKQGGTKTLGNFLISTTQSRDTHDALTIPSYPAEFVLTTNAQATTMRFDGHDTFKFRTTGSTVNADNHFLIYLGAINIGSSQTDYSLVTRANSLRWLRPLDYDPISFPYGWFVNGNSTDINIYKIADNPSYPYQLSFTTEIYQLSDTVTSGINWKITKVSSTGIQTVQRIQTKLIAAGLFGGSLGGGLIFSEDNIADADILSFYNDKDGLNKTWFRKTSVVDFSIA